MNYYQRNNNMQVSGEDTSKLKDMDEGLTQILLDKLNESLTHYSSQNLIQCYYSLKGIYSFISHLSFKDKDEIELINKEVDIKIEEMQGKPQDQLQEMKIGEAQIEFKDIINDYIKLIPKALQDLGKFLKVYTYNDIGTRFSNESFGANIDTIEEEKQELCKLTVNELIKLLNKDHIHIAYTRHYIKTKLSVKNE